MDVISLGGDTYVNVAALVSILGQAKVVYDQKAAQLGTKDALLIAAGCKLMCDDLRVNLLKL